MRRTNTLLPHYTLSVFRLFCFNCFFFFSFLSVWRELFRLSFLWSVWSAWVCAQASFARQCALLLYENIKHTLQFVCQTLSAFLSSVLIHFFFPSVDSISRTPFCVVKFEIHFICCCCRSIVSIYISVPIAFINCHSRCLRIATRCQIDVFYAFEFYGRWEGFARRPNKHGRINRNKYENDVVVA